MKISSTFASLSMRNLWRRAAGRLSYNKVCNLEDFSHPELVKVIRSLFPHEIQRFGPTFPSGREYRKHWEVAMAVRALTKLGAVHQDAEILGVGAGAEPTIFYLTNHVRRVFATDLYLDSGIWHEFANTSMLTNPGKHWPSPWNPRRLVVQHMNGLQLHYEDNSFEGIFSSSSIEHFGTLEDMKRCIAEMFRVLKPGGILSVSTEYRVEGPPPGLPGCLMFNSQEIEQYFVGGFEWALASPFDSRLSAATLSTEKLQDDLMKDFDAHFQEHGELIHHELDFRAWPQLVLRLGDHVITSAHLALRKKDM